MMAQIQQDNDRLNLNAKKFNMWIFIFCSFMLFAAFTSGFIVYVGGKEHGLNVILPGVFKYSTIVLVVSSITMFLASRAAKGMQFAQQRLFLLITAVLGVAFMALQVYGWNILSYQLNVRLIDPNAARSFFYVMTFVHILHIIGGLIFLFWALASTFKKTLPVINTYKMQMAGIFWHFLDIIWIYLYVFLLLNQY